MKIEDHFGIQLQVSQEEIPVKFYPLTQHFRGSIFEPRLGIRLHRSNAAERDNLIARAEDRVEALLAAPRPPTMDEQTRNELLKIEARYSQT